MQYYHPTDAEREREVHQTHPPHSPTHWERNGLFSGGIVGEINPHLHHGVPPSTRVEEKGLIAGRKRRSNPDRTKASSDFKPQGVVDLKTFNSIQAVGLKKQWTAL